MSPVRDNAGRLTHDIGVQTDVTERKQAEEELLKSQLRLRNVVASSPAILFTLQSHGYTVVEACDVADAIRKIESRRPALDILVTDVNMPGLSGRKVAEYLRNHYPGIKVLYTSGYTDDAVVRHGILQADVAFLRKPYTLLSLVRKVREILDQK